MRNRKARRGKTVHWAWIIVAVFSGFFMGFGLMCLLVMASRGEDFKDGITTNRPKEMTECDAERRVLALSIERVK